MASRVILSPPSDKEEGATVGGDHGNAGVRSTAPVPCSVAATGSQCGTCKEPPGKLSQITSGSFSVLFIFFLKPVAF